MDYQYLEPIFVAAWTIAMIVALIGKSPAARTQRLVLLFGPAFTILLDYTNFKLLGEERAVWYPQSLLFFPDYRFPVALLFLGGFFAWLVYVVAQGIAKSWGTLAGVATFLATVALCFLMEHYFSSIDYWRYPNRLPEKWLIYTALYGSYLVFATLSIGSALGVSSLLAKRKTA